MKEEGKGEDIIDDESHNNDWIVDTVRSVLGSAISSRISSMDIKTYEEMETKHGNIHYKNLVEDIIIVMRTGQLDIEKRHRLEDILLPKKK